MTRGPDPLTLEVVRLDPDLPLPASAHEDDAGVDLRARVSVSVPPAGGRVLVPTGIAIALPPGTAGFVLPRSGLASRHGVTVANAPGLIDAGYRDEVHVALLNTDPNSAFEVQRGDRIAQLVVQRVERVTWVAVSELSGRATSADRGGGFGHSGLA